MSPINPMDMLRSAIANGINPISIMQQNLGGDPRMAQAMKMIQGKTPAELQQIATNMARERGTTVEQIAQSLGINITR